MSSNVLNAFKQSKKDVPDIRYVLPGSKEEIFLRPFTTKDQKAILKAIEKEDHILIQEAFDQLLRNCVVNDKFDPAKLFSKDRECLLVAISKESVNDGTISHAWRCKKQKCEVRNELTVAIDDLDFEDAVEESTIEKEVTFDAFEFTVKLKVPTREDEKKIIAIGKKAGGADGISQTDVFDATIASVIKQYKRITTNEIKDSDGEVKIVEHEEFQDIKFEERVAIYEQLGVTDKAKIEEYFKSIKDYGFDLTIPNQVCKCSEVQDVKLEWMDFFIV